MSSRKRPQKASKEAEKLLKQIADMRVFRSDRFRPVLDRPLPPAESFRSDSETPRIPSYAGRSIFIPQPPPKYDGDLAVREAAAQAEIEVKKLRVAPLWNKGGYMYIDDGVNPKDIGKKTSQLEDPSAK